MFPILDLYKPILGIRIKRAIHSPFLREDEVADSKNPCRIALIFRTFIMSDSIPQCKHYYYFNYNSITLGGLFVYNHAWLHAIFAFITAGVLMPFFYYNVFGASHRRHRIFMGDTGTLTLGFSISFLVISYAMNNQEILPFSEGAIVVASSTVLIPVLDVARVMWWRFRHGVPLFKPDRNHIHHKFLRMGFSHHATMLLILLIAVLFGLFNIIMVQYISNNVVLFLDIVLWIVLHLWLEKREKKILLQRDLNGKSTA